MDAKATPLKKELYESLPSNKILEIMSRLASRFKFK